MIRTGMPAIALLVATLAISATYADSRQAADDEPQDPPVIQYDTEPATEIPTEGFWPTPAMMDGILMRIVDDMERDYEFDFEQRDQALALLRDYVPQFMDENRAEIQTLMNMYFEALLNDQAPSPEEVAVWAQRVLPLMDEFRGMGETFAEEMRPFLTDEQVVKLEGNIEAFRTGMDIGMKRMQSWAEGNYDPNTEWIRSPDFERKERDRQREAEQQMLAARDEAMTRVREGAAAGNGGGGEAPPPQAQPTEPAASPPPPRTERPTAPVRPQGQRDEWEIYVEQFCNRYDFTADQRAAADRYLKGRQQERDRIRLRMADKLRRIEAMYKSAKTPEELRKAESARQEANAPIDRTFDRLKQQLDRLPTREQRAKAGPQAQPNAAPAKPAGSDSQPADGGK
jgi:hypothetical protein